MPRVHSDNFVLINLEGGDSFVFDYFPREIQGTDRANWEPQDVTIGMKPLFYANREPRRLSIPELFFNDEDGIGDQIDALRALKDELPKLGRPPALLAAYGDRQLRCVMEEVSITEGPFRNDGNPRHARVSLQLLELQEEGEAVHSTVSPVPDSGLVVGG
jgi:phage protein U